MLNATYTSGRSAKFEMALTFKQTQHNKTWQDLLVEESERSLRHRKGMRDWTFRRMYLSIFILVGSGFVLYCSLFYVGAFVDMGKIVGFSQSIRAQNTQKNITSMADVKPRTIFSPIIDSFSVNRIYMRKGQSIFATYSLPSNVELSLTVRQCKSQPIREVFKCKMIGEQNSVVRNRSYGFIEFTVSEPGFYYFENRVLKLPNTDLRAFYDYRIIWQRGGKRAHKLRPLANLR